ncbi:hypothetical protein F5Y03DRAFT_344450 [Xylaria venustula]|nr:hypothetical protein F5Y03DRAFT_344450 [Xylaria venustula]
MICSVSIFAGLSNTVLGRGHLHSLFCLYKGEVNWAFASTCVWEGREEGGNGVNNKIRLVPLSTGRTAISVASDRTFSPPSQSVRGGTGLAQSTLFVPQLFRRTGRHAAALIPPSEPAPIHAGV